MDGIEDDCLAQSALSLKINRKRKKEKERTEEQTHVLTNVLFQEWMSALAAVAAVAAFQWWALPLFGRPLPARASLLHGEGHAGTAADAK